MAQLTKISNLPKEAVEECLKELEERYKSDDHGLELVEIGEAYMFSPKESLWGFLKDRYGKKNDTKLSKAARETLSIIAYSQPITKAEVENIRGVSVDGMMRILIQRNLIKEVGKKDVPGKPVQYGTTKEFLSVFRLKSIADLPKLDEQERERFELNG